MKFLKKSLVLFLLPLFAFTVAHKFYVSVTHISYSEKDKSIQITSRLFIDDFEQVLLERYGFEAKLATKEESHLSNDYIEKYFKTKFLVSIDDAQVQYKFLGKKYDNDVMICYLEITEIDINQTKSIGVKNELLTDLFEEQQNVVHFKVNGKKKSFVLIRENNKGMLNL